MFVSINPVDNVYDNLSNHMLDIPLTFLNEEINPEYKHASTIKFRRRVW